MKNPVKLIFCIVGSELVGITSGLFTTSAIPGWYQTLNKPFFSPPNWVFGPVWTTLYFLMGVSAYLIWSKGLNKDKNKQAMSYFIIQLALNFSWSIVFFNLQSIALAFLIILGLLYFIYKTYQAFSKISSLAGKLLIPYLLWVSFASILNLSLLILNP